MIVPIKTVASSPSSTADRRGYSAPTPAVTPPPPTAQDDEPLRLVIEPAQGAGQGYTYKLFDRTTGALLIELPREQADQLGQNPGYSAGQVFNAKV